MNIGLDAVTVGISMISKIAFTSHTVVSFIGAAFSTSIEDPEVSLVAVALAVLEVTVDTAVLVAAALAVDDSVARVAQTALSPFVPVCVQRASVGHSALSIVDRQSVFTNTHTISVA